MPQAAERNLVVINSAIYRAAGFREADCEAYLQGTTLPPSVYSLPLPALLQLVQFLGSTQEHGTLRHTQIRAYSGLDSAIKTASAATRVLMDWPVSFRKMLRAMVPECAANAADLNFRRIFGNFYVQLFRALPRINFGFLHEEFERFILDDWEGFVREQNRVFYGAIRKNSQWISAAEGEKITGIFSLRIGTVVRRGDVEGICFKQGSRNECWIKRDSLTTWAATHKGELARYMMRPEAMRILGLTHRTLLRVAQAGLIRYVSGAQQFFPHKGYYFLREDIFSIKHAFERAAINIQPYSCPGEIVTLEYGCKMFMNRDSGLSSAIRAVIEGKLVPVGHAKQSRGIMGYLFRSDELLRYHPMKSNMPPGKFLNYKEAASILGLDSRDVGTLVKQGVLQSLNEYRSGIAKLISISEVERFRAQYVDAAIFAKSSGETLQWVRRCFREAKIPILEILVDGNKHKTFLRRALAKKIRIIRRCSYKDLPQVKFMSSIASRM